MLSERDGSALLAVRLQPRASRDELVGERDGRLAVRVTAPPVEKRANEALRKLLAERIGIAKGRITIVRGQRSRDKLIRLEGIAARVAARILSPD